MQTFDLMNAVYQSLGTIRGGSLAFWGHFFGRPYDNIHQLTGADATDEKVILYFDHAECLILDSPDQWSIEHGAFVIRQAQMVRFQWFLYGEIPSPEVLRFVQYQRVGNEIIFSTDYLPNVERPPCDPAKPAAELHVM